MSARDRILTKIRRLAGPGDATAAARRVERHPENPKPAQVADPVNTFIDRANGLSSTVDRVARMTDVPRAVADYLRRMQLPATAVGWSTLDCLDWASAGVALETRAARGDDLVGVTGVFCAIAETATLMVCGGEATPASVSLLPETHIAVLPVDRLVPNMEAAWALLRQEAGQLPRAVNFISGPSRTADIEQTVTLGAHGPYRVHVILVE